VNIQHFFDCYIAKIVWRINYFTLKIDPPVNINHIRACSVSSQSMWIEWDWVGLNPK
jgi:hypothetical protein